MDTGPYLVTCHDCGRMYATSIKRSRQCVVCEGQRRQLDAAIDRWLRKTTFVAREVERRAQEQRAKELPIRDEYIDFMDDAVVYGVGTLRVPAGSSVKAKMGEYHFWLGKELYL